MMKFLIFLSVICSTFSAFAASSCHALFSGNSEVTAEQNVVTIEKNQITVNGVPLPQLYGAEFQYFRLRGGYGKNVPREKVIEIWKRGLDQMIEAGMNAISFYIPWDFHEYAPGKFDFTGKVDQDGDGKPDYPSRDILTFLKLVQERGIKSIMLRPGPYINAEWGFLGFGAVPEWFHNMYPDSHMKNSKGQNSRLFDYHNPDFLRHSKIWFAELNRQVLKNVIGKDKPGIFLQLDNETNFQWQSIYNHDYGSSAITRYQTFLKNRYRSLKALNQAQGTNWESWKDVTAPTVPEKNLVQDKDWYRFQDWSIFTYLKLVRSMWEEIGVQEPKVIFTVAESFNAPKNGLLPNYKLKNKKGETGLMTINVYPKTWPGPENVLLNQPHKADYDLIAAAASNKYYLGGNQEAVIGPEIHTGWFGNTKLSEEARKQTYLTLIGRGLKAQFLYYFNEGYNFDVNWAKNKITPYFRALHTQPRYIKILKNKLPDTFWAELQEIVDQNFLAGWNVKGVMMEDVKAAQKLHFATPLDGDARPTKHFELVKEIGQKIIKPFGQYLAQTVSLKDEVAILIDSGSLNPSSIKGIDSRELHSDFAGGLVGYIQQAGLNPSIHHWGINSTKELAKNKVVFVQDSGTLDPKLITWLAKYVANGGVVMNFIGDSLAKHIGAPATSQISVHAGPVKVNYLTSSFEALGNSVSSYELGNNAYAQPVLFQDSKVIGYKFKHGNGYMVQIGAVIHDAFNSAAYGFLNDVPQRRAILDDIMASENINPYVKIEGGGDRVSVFARKIPGDNRLWITVKSGQLEKVKLHIQINEKLVGSGAYRIENVMSGQVTQIDGATLANQSFRIELPANGSDAYLISPLE